MGSDYAKRMKDAIDDKIEDAQEDGFRAHLGASIVGRMCEREIWYGWRWAVSKKHNARILRLFDRGHKEEFRFEDWVEGNCEKFWALDPRTGEQIRVSDFHGYFGGSLDGIIRNPVDIRGDFLTEFKTHGDKSFQKLLVHGVTESKPEHYVQMQIYLHYHPKLSGAFYMAINKNDDDLYIEFVERDEEAAQEALAKVKRILSSKEPSPRHDKASEGHYYCRYFCDYLDTCFKKAEPHVSCRSCAFVQVRDKGFTCGNTQEVLSTEDQKKACDSYERDF